RLPRDRCGCRGPAGVPLTLAGAYFPARVLRLATSALGAVTPGRFPRALRPLATRASAFPPADVKPRRLRAPRAGAADRPADLPGWPAPPATAPHAVVESAAHRWLSVRTLR